MSRLSLSRRQFLAASTGVTGVRTVGERGAATHPTLPSENDSSGVPADEGTDTGAEPHDDVVLEQADRCIPLTPLSYQNQTIQEFYGVDHPQEPGFHWPEESHTATNLERPQTSRLFLYRGPDGLGYVIIHGAADGPGGAASFGIRHTPRSGKLLVHDDQGDPVRCRPNCALHWSWGADDGSDGAVYHPLAAEFEVEITPRFNDHARLDAPDGEVKRWQVLSGDARVPEVFDLALDQPVTLRTDCC